ncbi:hypothetical protein [Marinobacterium rhizophilum]|uniref:Uncharacterized protein n=1 Tax=Marinobacterium rhizophilum TaxID=420402 RepID=A0ABY5HD85_9GAMM|nr:hypothetical protein [Marinobacterium rhizophilum]UTW10178.1 hypothetical protein KDW95_12725 [Marinobacterium rhizophilum]
MPRAHGCAVRACAIHNRALFARDNCLMRFGDGKKAIMELTTAVNETV